MAIDTRSAGGFTETQQPVGGVPVASQTAQTSKNLSCDSSVDRYCTDDKTSTLPVSSSRTLTTPSANTPVGAALRLVGIPKGQPGLLIERLDPSDINGSMLPEQAARIFSAYKEKCSALGEPGTEVSVVQFEALNLYLDLAKVLLDDALGDKKPLSKQRIESYQKQQHLTQTGFIDQTTFQFLLASAALSGH